jgi:hypothetical protein
MMKERFLQKRETFAEEECRQADHSIATIISIRACMVCTCSHKEARTCKAAIL